MNSEVDTKSKITSAQRTLERVLGKGDSEMNFKYVMISIKIVARMGWKKNKKESWDHVDSCFPWSLTDEVSEVSHVQNQIPLSDGTDPNTHYAGLCVWALGSCHLYLSLSFVYYFNEFI